MHERPRRSQIADREWSRVLGEAEEIGLQHDTTAATERLVTRTRDIVCDHDEVKPRTRRQLKRKVLSALRVQKESIAEAANPSFRTPHLIGTGLHRSLEPARPTPLGVWRPRIETMLVGKNDDVVLENDEKIADFLSVRLRADALVSVDGRVASQGQKCPVAKSAKVALGRRNSFRLLDRLRGQHDSATARLRLRVAVRVLPVNCYGELRWRHPLRTSITPNHSRASLWLRSLTALKRLGCASREASPRSATDTFALTYARSTDPTLVRFPSFRL